MLNENAKLWVEDLRTTKSPQAKNALHRINPNNREYDSFCCLGRACILYNTLNPNNQVQIKEKETSDGPLVSYGADYEAVLPTQIKEWLGLTDCLGRYRDDSGNTSLANKNDEGYSFSTIAAIIESEPEGLFVK